MNENPLVSVIVPVYNVQRYLNECLLSVARQTYSNIECICVDDGSTDSSGNMLDEFAKTDSRFRVIHQRNGGLGAARNTGMNHARGQFLTFVDSDDLIEPQFIERGVAELLRTVDLDIWMGQMICVDDLNQAMPSQPRPVSLLNSTDPLKDSGTADGRYYLYSACAKLFRAALVQKDIYRFPTNVRFGEDSPFMTRVYSEARRLVVGDFYVYRRRLHTGTLIGTQLTDRVPDFLTNIKDLLSFAHVNKRESVLNPVAGDSAVGSFAKIFLSTTPAGAKGYAAALCSHPDFRHVILGTIARYASLKYRVCGWLMWLLPSKVIEKLLYAAWRIRKMLRRR